MRFGKKTNIAETKKTRSCVVRLEKVSQPSPATSRRTPTTTASQKAQQKGGLVASATRNRKNSVVSISPGMGATPKHPTTASYSREEKSIKGPIKKRPVGGTGSKPQTPQQRQHSTNANMSALRSNQKIKTIPRANRVTTTISSPQVAASPTRDDTPTPTIAAGRSRRAIKPNPKYASEDMVTPKMMRNVGMTKTAAANDTKQRKVSSSSDDFYNNNSDDDYEDPSKKTSSNSDDMERDKAYKVDEKEAGALDSDISEIEEELIKPVARSRGRPRKVVAIPPQNAPKTTNQSINSNLKRSSNPQSTLPVRTAPTQLQQLRRSLASANAQRNQSLLAGSSSMTQKRKLDESLDSDDSDTSYSVARKQMLLSNSSGVKVRVPIKQNSVISNTTPLNRNRVLGVHKIGSSTASSSLNGKSLSSQIMERRKLIESAKTSVDIPPKTGVKSNLLGNKIHQLTPGRNNRTPTTAFKSAAVMQTPSGTSKTIIGKSDVTKNRERTSSPRPSMNRESISNTTKAVIPSSAAAFTTQQLKKLPTLTSKPLEKPKTASTSNPSNMSAASLALSKSMYSRTKPLPLQQNNTKTSASPAVIANQTVVINDESPNSTMDDFETMPTFTIVNVNDIINKKGDVLITKSKTPPNSGPKTTVIEFSESISLDEDEDDGDELGDNIQHDKSNKHPVVPAAINKLPSTNISKVELNKNKNMGARNNNETIKKLIPTDNYSKLAPIVKPQILNHKLGLRNNQRVTAKTTAPLPPLAPEKPAPRILNSVVAKRTQPVKPMIANLDDSAEESFPLSLDEEETEDEAESKSFGTTEKKSQAYSMDLDTDDTDSQNSEADEPNAPSKALTTRNTSAANTTTPSPQAVQRRRRPPNSISTPIVVSNKKRILTPAAAKENSLAATNQQVNDSKSSSLMPLARKAPAEKVVISKQGDKIIKKITCFETWYVINMPLEPKRQTIIRNQLDIPLIKLANNAKAINLPSDLWSCKVTLYELSAMTLAKSTLITYTGDLTEYNINEEDRAKYQPSCVMFRRSIENRQQSRMPYDRAVIFKNKTFSTNIEGKNIRLVGAPSVINSEREIEILLEVVDALTLQSDFVENATALQ